MRHGQSDYRGLKYLLEKYARPMWKHIILIIFLTLTGNIFVTMQPLIMAGMMNTVMGEYTGELHLGSTKVSTENKSPSFFNLNTVGHRIKGLVQKIFKAGDLSKVELLIYLAIIFLAVVFISSLFNYLATLINKWANASVVIMIRKDMMNHFFSQDISFFNRHRSGELISRLTVDAKSTAQGIVPLIQSFFHQGTLIIIYSTFLISTNILLPLAVGLLVILQYGVFRLTKKPIKNSSINLNNKSANVLSTLHEAFTNIRVIKSFGSDKYELDRITNDLIEERKTGFKAAAFSAVQGPMNMVLSATTVIGILIMVSFQLNKGAMSLEGALMFVYVGRMLIEPINKFSVNFSWIQGLLASFHRIQELLQTRSEVVDGHIIKNKFNTSIEVKDISFAYDDKDVINDLSFTVKKGEVLAIVGPSGGGKSTLTDLILRFYDPQEGKVLIDNIDLKDVKVNRYRKLFGVVPQESQLFNDTIEENIRYRREQIDHAKVKEAAIIANASGFISEMPKGYETFVGDRGIRLSGGQRQRISVARAVAGDPEILIFDEATSSLDTHSERQVQIAIEQVLKNSTAIIIAHRLSSILNADRILVIDNGTVEAEGDHTELLESSAIYRKLYDLQFGVEESLGSSVY